MSVQKKKPTRKKQPDRSSAKRKSGKSKAKKKVNGNSYLPWFVGLVLVCAGVALWLLLPPLENGGGAGAFEEKRIALNKALRESLETLGIDPRPDLSMKPGISFPTVILTGKFLTGE